jgi:polar amino acid transport system substrate-binding protein
MRTSLRVKAGRRSGVIAIALLLALALALAVSACGGSSSTTTTASPTASTTGVTVAGVTITEDATLSAMLPQAIKDSGVLRAATDIPYPPFEMWATEGSTQPTGFDYDLGRAMAAKLGLGFEFPDIVFDTLIPALNAGKADIVLAAMVDNKERQQAVDFVDYATVGSVLLTLKGNPSGLTTLDALAGKSVAAQSGTIQAGMLQALKKKFAAEGKPALEVLTFPKDSDALLAVKSGKAVANFVQLPNAAYTVKTAGNGATYEIVVDPAAPSGYAPSILGSAVAKTNTQLRDAIQKTLQALIDDGTYGKILAEYGLEGSAVTSAQVNQGK